MLSNISTIVTYNLINEFYILEHSLSLFNKKTIINVLCDDKSFELIKKLNKDNINLYNDLKNLDYLDIKNRGKSWEKLMINKIDIIEKSLEKFGETLYVDTDIVFLNTFEKVVDKDLCLSQHLIHTTDEAKYGKYNGGYFYVKNKNYLNWFRNKVEELTIKNEYPLSQNKLYEQYSLTLAEKDFETESFEIQHNFGWWRLFQCNETEARYKKFGYGANVFYDKTPLISVHVHMVSDGYKDVHNDKFADIIMKLLSVSKKSEHKNLYDFICKIRSGWNPIDIPTIIVPHPSIANHSGDTFRELVDMWEDEGLCNKIYSKETPLVWVNKIGDILLYDRPTLEWFGNTKYNFALFGNIVPDFENSSSWIFWGRRPKLMKKIIDSGINLFEQRDIQSIFLGKVENNVQQSRRTNYDWSNSCQIFEMPIRGEYKYTQQEYLELLNRSRFGLCLAGYGRKCNREIELFALGVVPIITDGVDLTYYNDLIEGIHYLKISKPEEVKPIIDSISKDKWLEMSNAGREWYEKNCSPIGSFNTTFEIIKSKTNKI